ncbi:MAG: HAD-IIB family hydrolase [Pseudomonadota bacterium]
MDLIVFDLDGTLLNKASTLSSFTRETLSLLAEQGIGYTIATGRTLNDCHDILDQSRFFLPQAYKNGVVIWNPDHEHYSHTTFLTLGEIQAVVEAAMSHDLSPFLFTVEAVHSHRVYHPPLTSAIELQLADLFRSRRGLEVRPVSELPADAEISNISALGDPHAVEAIEALVSASPGLVAYAGVALEGQHLKWIDVHHEDASKGNAVTLLRHELGAERVLCFGDSDNDLSMFQIADEAYAPSNAKAELKAAATAVIGDHDADGVARFLRERFNLSS